MTSKIVERVEASPFLMFQGEGAKALEFYVSAIPGAHVEQLTLYGEGEAGAAGTIKLARLRIGGLSVICTDSPIKHAFGFTPSFSFFLNCEDEAEVRRLSGLLGEGGQELMPAGQYGFSRLFAWVSDRFGVSWQINCP